MDNTTTSATNFPTLIGDLNAGVFEQQISRAISDVAANVVTHGKQGELVIRLKLKQIGDSSQVAMNHALKFVVPTARGKIVEETAGDTPLHVGRGGKLSLYPEEQTDMFKRDGSLSASAGQNTPAQH